MERGYSLSQVFVFCSFLGIVALCAPSFAFAHGVGGEDKQVGDFLIDFSHDSFFPRANEKMRLTFELYENGRALPFDSAALEIRMQNRNGPMQKWNLTPEIRNRAAVSHTFPTQGNYTLTVSFLSAGERIVQTTFALGIAEERKPLFAMAQQSPVDQIDAQQRKQDILSQMKSCYDKITGDCYEDVADALTQKYALSDILSVFTEEESLPSIFARCHEVTHYLGRIEYAKKGSIKEAYLDCTPVCHGGCYHGVMEAHFDALDLSASDARIGNEIRDACGTIEEYEYPRKYYECLHGIGHAMMLITQDELPDSLKLCDSLKDASEWDACYSGAFMESSSSSTNLFHASKYTDESDPLYPCSILDERYLKTCYTYQSSYFAIISKHDWKKVVSLCSQVPAKYQEGCFRVVGTNQVGYTQDMTIMRDDCSLIEDGKMRLVCFEGVVDALGGRYENEPKRIAAFCDLLDTSSGERESCYRRMGVQVQSWNYDAQQYCSEASEGYVEACMKGTKSQEQSPAVLSSPLVKAQQEARKKIGEESASAPSQKKQDTSAAKGRGFDEASPDPLGIIITEKGFFPNDITIPKGTAVTWINQGERPHWPASDYHPTHTTYPGSSILKCQTEEKGDIFDSCEALERGESYTFVFNEEGVWNAHDHVYPGLTMTIRVVAEETQKPSLLSLSKKEGKEESSALGVRESMRKIASLFNRNANEILEMFIPSIRLKKEDGAVSQGQMAEPQKKSQARGEASIGISTADYSGMQRRIKEMAAKDPAQAWAEVKATYIVNGQVIGNAHELAHIVGNEIYSQEGFDGIRICDPAFSFGCYHGVTEQMLIDEGIESLPIAEKKCVELFPQEFAQQSSCLHGIGHGLLPYEGMDVEGALSDCDSLNERHRPYCYDGVFMENSFGAKPDSDWDFCAGFDERYQPSCANYLFFGDYKTHADACERAPSQALRERCLITLGQRAAQGTKGDAQGIFSICSESKEGKNSCLIHAAVETIFQEYGDWRTSYQHICSMADSAWQQPCAQNTQWIISAYKKEALGTAPFVPAVAHPNTNTAARGGGGNVKSASAPFPANEGTMIAGSQSDEIQKIKGTKNYEERSAHYLELIKRVGPINAQEELLRSGLPFDGETHLLNHVVGEYLYENFGAAGLSQCRDYFLASCYHGFIIETIADKGIEGAYEIMENCKAFGPTVVSQCSHALGHGFLAWNGYAFLVEALDMCDKTSQNVDDFPTFNCLDGVFMENIWAVHEGEATLDNWVNYSDAFYPCNDKRIPSRYLGGCWANQPTIMYRIFNADAKRVGEECLKVEDMGHRRTCFDALGRQIHPIANGNVNEVFRLCRMMPKEWQAPCIRTVATAELSVGGRTLPFAICAQAEEGEKDMCYRGIFGSMSAYTPNPAEFKGLCEKITDEGWEEECREYGAALGIR